MTNDVLWVILAVAIGLGAAQPIETTSTSAQVPGRGIAGECYINGVWYNPCPEPTDPNPDTSPKNQMP